MPRIKRQIGGGGSRSLGKPAQPRRRLSMATPAAARNRHQWPLAASAGGAIFPAQNGAGKTSENEIRKSAASNKAARATLGAENRHKSPRRRHRWRTNNRSSSPASIIINQSRRRRTAAMAAESDGGKSVKASLKRQLSAPGAGNQNSGK